MPISPIVLQRRHAEIGRIRLGSKQPTSSGRTRPAKLEAFRFTSPSQSYIADLAELYGGTAQPWDNNGKSEWEVYSDAKSIPVIAVKGGLTQWMETWSGGGCIHRCDGEKGVDGEPCDPDEFITVGKDKTRLYVHRDAKPTTRLAVMLPELEAVGVWRMETHGWNAAAEIPAVADLAAYVGDLVPAVLHLVERRSVKDGQTSRFVVPVLDLQIGAARLRQIVAAVASGTELPAVAAPAQITSGPAVPDYAAQAAASDDVDEVRGLWEDARAAGHLTDALKAALSARVAEIKSHVAPPAPTEPPASAPAAQGDDADAIWQRILKVAGQAGLSMDDINTRFAQANAGLLPESAAAAELAVFYDALCQAVAA